MYNSTFVHTWQSSIIKQLQISGPDARQKQPLDVCGATLPGCTLLLDVALLVIVPVSSKF